MEENLNITVEAGATINNAMIDGTRIMTILPGGSAKSATIAAGGSCIVNPMGTLIDTNVQFGGMLFLDYNNSELTHKVYGERTKITNGAVINGFTVLSSAFSDRGFVLEGVAVSAGAGINNSGAVLNQNLDVTDAVIESDGKLVLHGGTLRKGTIQSGGVLSAVRGSAASTTVLAGGRLIHSGANAFLSDTTVSGGGGSFHFQYKRFQHHFAGGCKHQRLPHRKQ